MAMSDCIKCWNTPCSCGWNYKDYSKERLSKYIAEITQYRSKKDAKAIIEKALNEVDNIDKWYNETRV